MHSVKLAIGKKIFEVVVKTDFKQSPYIEFPQNFPGACSQKDNNDSYLRWILNRLRTGEKLLVTVGQFDRVIKPDEDKPLTEIRKALNKVLTSDDLTEVSLKGLTRKIADFSQEWQKFLV